LNELGEGEGKLLRGVALWLAAVLLVLMVFVPAVVVGNWSWKPAGIPGVPSPSHTDLIIGVYDNDSGSFSELPLEEYVVGVVAAEMPASFELEALKAQAVVARTYAVNSMRIFGGHGCPDYPGADICTDPTTSQAWFDTEDLRREWGLFGYYLYRRRVEQAVRETMGLIVTYGGQPIDAVYHSTSGGKTETARAVWGGDQPYLQSVPSPHEEEAPKYTTTKRFGFAELAARLEMPLAELERCLREEGLQITEYTPGGRVGAVTVGQHTWSGRDLREALDLASTWFDIGVERNTVTLQVRGYGHGVGMSQYGANAMAERGSTYVEIIKHYYTGVQVLPIFAE
jgi:stage II sporulation protein D